MDYRLGCLQHRASQWGAGDFSRPVEGRIPWEITLEETKPSAGREAADWPAVQGRCHRKDNEEEDLMLRLN